MHYLLWKLSRAMVALGWRRPWYRLALRHWFRTRAGRAWLIDNAR